MDNTFDYGCTKVSLAFRGPSMMNIKGGTPNHLDFPITEKSQLSKFFCGTEVSRIKSRYYILMDEHI
jgi:hypothetical protein